MYNQLLYFIVALLFFTVQRPGAEALLPPLETLGLSVGLYVLYGGVCLLFFQRLRTALLHGVPDSLLSIQYHRIHTRLSILALGMLVVYIYVLNIKFYLYRIPGFESSVTLSGVVGLMLLLVHQSIVWALSYPIYQRIYNSTIGRWGFIKGQLSFSSAVLVPWLLVSILSDFLPFLPLPDFLQGDTGEYLVLGFVLMLFILFAPPMVVRLWGCTSLPEGEVRREIEAFSREQRFAVGGFLLWPLFGGEVFTAGIVGVLPRLRYILITRGLLSILNIEELKAVVGHEIGHIRRFHLPFYMIFFLAYSWLTYSWLSHPWLTDSLSQLIRLGLLKAGLLTEAGPVPPSLYLSLVSLTYVFMTLVILLVYFRFIFGFFLRNSERQADLHALRLLGHPYALVSSLQKIAFYSGQIEDLPSWHHYSIRQRMDFLLCAHERPDLIRRHDRRLYGWAGVFMAVVVVLGLAGLQTGNAGFLREWRLGLHLEVAEEMMRHSPRDLVIQVVRGGLLLEMGRFGEAESTLREALELAPDDASLLNTLAWLYATGPPPYARPREALDLARRAVAAERSPQNLDTLAEAYYVNGRYVEALEAIEKALQGDSRDRAHFQKQKQKFEEALRSHPPKNDSGS